MRVLSKWNSSSGTSGKVSSLSVCEKKVFYFLKVPPAGRRGGEGASRVCLLTRIVSLKREEDLFSPLFVQTRMSIPIDCRATSSPPLENA